MLLLCGVVVGNALYLLGVTMYTPVAQFSGMAQVRQWSFFNVPATADYNVGYTTQALGRYAAQQLLHGHMPYWNPFEGLGSPLLGEMQSAALFPLTLFQAAPNGALLVHLALELVAACSTYALLRYMGTSRTASVTAGLAFGLCGTFVLLTNAPANAVAVLPLGALGVEVLWRSTQRERSGGWALLAVAIALTWVSGAPEVAYLNTLFLGFWWVLRSSALRGVALRRQVTKAIAAVAVGTALAAPALVAFVDYLRVGYTRHHATGSYAHTSLSTLLRPTELIPYAYGLFARHTSRWYHSILGHPGMKVSYVCVAVAILAVVGATGTRYRSLQRALGGWVLFSLCVVWGIAGLHQALDVLPGMSNIDVTRYLTPSLEFATVVLAAFGLDELIVATVSRRRRSASCGAVGALLLWSMWEAWGAHGALMALGSAHRDLAWLFWLPLLSGATVAWLLWRVRGRALRMALCAVVVLEVLINAGVPTMSGPRHYTVDTAVLTYLQHHVGLGRVYAIDGALAANYGTYFNVAQLDVNDVPVPQLFVDFESAELDSNSVLNQFNGTALERLRANGSSARAELLAHLRAYAATGTVFVLAPRATDAALGLPVVYEDAFYVVMRLASPAPYVEAAHCTVTTTSVTRVTTTCSRASTLVRRELFMPGWVATRHGHSIAVKEVDHLYQSVRVPAGRSTTTFTFTPPHEGFAWGGALLGVLAVLGSGFVALRRRRKVIRDPR